MELYWRERFEKITKPMPARASLEALRRSRRFGWKRPILARIRRPRVVKMKWRKVNVVAVEVITGRQVKHVRAD